MRGLLDTSVFIAAESRRPLDEDRIPDETAVSVVTLAELQAGVLVASDVAVRARRLATLAAVSDVEVVESTPPGVFDDAAQSAVRKWIYEPRKENGVAVMSQAKARLVFDAVN